MTPPGPLNIDRTGAITGPCSVADFKTANSLGGGGGTDPGVYYFRTDGDDGTGDGTLAHPWQTGAPFLAAIGAPAWDAIYNLDLGDGVNLGDLNFGADSPIHLNIRSRSEASTVGAIVAREISIRIVGPLTGGTVSTSVSDHDTGSITIIGQDLAAVVFGAITALAGSSLSGRGWNGGDVILENVTVGDITQAGSDAAGGSDENGGDSGGLTMRGNVVHGTVTQTAGAGDGAGVAGMVGGYLHSGGGAGAQLTLRKSLTISDVSVEVIKTGSYWAFRIDGGAYAAMFPLSSTAVLTPANGISSLAGSTSADLAGVLSDETGYASGAKAVFSSMPTFEQELTIERVSGSIGGRIKLRDRGNSYYTTITSSALAASRTIFTPDGNTYLPICAYHHTITGPTAGITVTWPNANFSVARIDAAQSIAGIQTFTDTTQTTGSGTGAMQLAGGLYLAKNLIGGGNVLCAGTGKLAFFTRSAIYSAADGRLSVGSDNGLSCTRFTFGAESTSCAALQISGTGITVGLGDGSTGGGNFAVSGTLTIGGGTAIKKSATYTYDLTGLTVTAGNVASVSVSASGVAAGDMAIADIPLQPDAIVLKGIRTGSGQVLVDFFNTDLLSAHTFTGTLKVRTFTV